MNSSRRKKPPSSSKKVRRQKLLLIIIAVVVIVLAVCLILPNWVLDFVNKHLANISGYYGHVDDIDISLYRGAYQVQSIYINKKDSVTQEETPFFSAPHVDISIEWVALLKGEIVSKMDQYSPALQFQKKIFGKPAPKEDKKKV